MATATAIPDPRLIDAAGLENMRQVLAAEGYHVIGPAVQDGAIMLKELSPAAELPFGVRPCDLRAIAIRDRVLAQPGSRYAARRARLFVVAVNCTEPGETCFCASMGTGPGAEGGIYDLALTELVGELGHRFLVEVGSPGGADLLRQVPSEPAGDATVQRAPELKIPALPRR